MTQSKARIAKVKFAADLEIECLMLPDGSFGIGVSQIASVFQLDKTIATREVKALLGNGFQLDKTTSELNPKAVNYVTLKEFTSVCRALDKKGVEVAGRLIEIHLESNFTSVVSSAFGVKFSQEQVLQWVEARDTHKKGFHPLFTSWCKSDGCATGFDYIKKLSSFKVHCGLPGNLGVNDMTEEQLKQLNTGEIVYNKLRSKGMTHSEALDYLY
jgi:hypothetical protein